MARRTPAKRAKSAKRKAAGKAARKTAKKSAKKTAKRSVRKTAKRSVKKTVKRRVTKAARRTVRKRATAARSARPAARRPAARTAASPPPAPPRIRPGQITHTELASAEPDATRRWCADVLGWAFGESMPTPAGPYHMWRFDNGTGGGIRANNPPEVPGSIPYCEVPDIQEMFARALEAGADEMLSPQELPGGMGWIAIVAAPGGVAIGFWAMR